MKNVIMLLLMLTCLSVGYSNAEPNNGDVNSVVKASEILEKLEAEIAKQQLEYQKRPRHLVVGINNKDSALMAYVEKLERKFESLGSSNFPKDAMGNALYGQLQILVTIKPDGTLFETKITKSSGNQTIDESAIHIVQFAAPYPAFSPDMPKPIDLLSIVRTWTFTKQDSNSMTVNDVIAH